MALSSFSLRPSDHIPHLQFGKVHRNAMETYGLRTDVRPLSKSCYQTMWANYCEKKWYNMEHSGLVSNVEKSLVNFIPVYLDDIKPSYSFVNVCQNSLRNWNISACTSWDQIKSYIRTSVVDKRPRSPDGTAAPLGTRHAGYERLNEELLLYCAAADDITHLRKCAEEHGWDAVLDVVTTPIENQSECVRTKFRKYSPHPDNHDNEGAYFSIEFFVFSFAYRCFDEILAQLQASSRNTDAIIESIASLVCSLQRVAASLGPLSCTSVQYPILMIPIIPYCLVSDIYDTLVRWHRTECASDIPGIVEALQTDTVGSFILFYQIVCDLVSESNPWYETYQKGNADPYKQDNNILFA